MAYLLKDKNIRKKLNLLVLVDPLKRHMVHNTILDELDLHGQLNLNFSWWASGAMHLKHFLCNKVFPRCSHHFFYGTDREYGFGDLSSLNLIIRPPLNTEF